MAILPVIDSREREEIRARLKVYMEQHAIGAPRLFERMSYVLDGIDRRYVDLRSLQRFLRDDVRTDDEKVVRYRRFIDIAMPEKKSSPATIFAELIRKNTFLPNPDSLMDEVEQRFSLGAVTGRKPLADYAGRYVECIDPDEDCIRGENTSENALKHWVCLPDPSGVFLLVAKLIRQDAPPAGESSYVPISFDAIMLPMGSADLLVVELDGFGDGGSFTLFRDVSGDSGSIILDGLCLYTIGALAPRANMCTVRLTSLDNPD